MFYVVKSSRLTGIAFNAIYFNLSAIHQSTQSSRMSTKAFIGAVSSLPDAFSCSPAVYQGTFCTVQGFVSVFLSISAFFQRSSLSLMQ